MVQFPPWLALATLGAGVANLLLLRYIWPWREEPGGRWFLVVIGVQVVWCFTYGSALLVEQRPLRYALEVLAWLPANWIGVLFLAFALEYTGRADLRAAGWFKVTVGFEVLSSLLLVTNPWFNVFWSGFQVAPAYGAATVTYVHHPWVFLQLLATFAQATVGIYVLMDTVVSYGPLFRRQAVALALTPFPPGLAFTGWVFQLPPYPLNLTPLMFLPHAMLDVYALFRNDMFEFPPTTRRTGERAAIDDLGTAVVIVDTLGRVVTLNPAAETLFDVEKRAVQGDPLDDCYAGGSVALEAGEQDLSLLTGGRRREFTVRVTSLSDAADTHVGYTIAFEDVTAERQRKQRLEVLNRILRHNLRNDLSVVQSYADHAAAVADSEAVTDAVAGIEAQSAGLLELGKKARRATTALDDERTTREEPLRDLVDAVADERRHTHDGDVTVDVPADVRLTTDPELVQLVVDALVENACEHAGGDVTVAYVGPDAAGHSALLEVRDDGPGIPDHELGVIEAGEETALEHGSGMGLWLVQWGTTALGGDVTFETGEAGTTVRLRLPGLVEDDAGTAGDRPAARDGTASGGEASDGLEPTAGTDGGTVEGGGAAEDDGSAPSSGQADSS